MQVRAIKFTGNGLIGHAAFTGQVTSPSPYQAPFQPVNGQQSVAVPAEAQRIVGFAYLGFTKVVGYNGTDNTGDVVFVGGGPGTYSWNFDVNCDKGLYVEVTGTGSGTAWCR